MNAIDEIRRLKEENKKLLKAIEWYTDKVTRQEVEKVDLLVALKLYLPILEGWVEASHLTDGFRPKGNKNDRILGLVRGVIEKMEGK